MSFGSKFKSTLFRLTTLMLSFSLVFGALLQVSSYQEIVGSATEQEPICNTDVHLHTKDCYLLEDGPYLTCGTNGFVVHTHNSKCFDKNMQLVCKLQEVKYHAHSDSCYEIEDVLSCGLDDTIVHKHNDECYIDAELFSEYLKAAEKHKHTDDCYKQVLVCENEDIAHEHSIEANCYESILVCDFASLSKDVVDVRKSHVHDESCFEHLLVCANTDPNHEHTKECYTTGDLICDTKTDTNGNVLYCGLEEGKVEHNHTQDCYVKNVKLICNETDTRAYAEHQHTDECWSDVAYSKDPLCGIEEHAHVDSCYPVVIENKIKVIFHDIDASGTEVDKIAVELGEPSHWLEDFLSVNKSEANTVSVDEFVGESSINDTRVPLQEADLDSIAKQLEEGTSNGDILKSELNGILDSYFWKDNVSFYDCVWYTLKDGKDKVFFDLRKLKDLNEGETVDLYTYSYVVNLALDAETSKTIFGREGQALNKEEFVYEGTDLIELPFTEEGSDIRVDIATLIGGGLSKNWNLILNYEAQIETTGLINTIQTKVNIWGAGWDGWMTISPDPINLTIYQFSGMECLEKGYDSGVGAWVLEHPNEKLSGFFVKESDMWSIFEDKLGLTKDKSQYIETITSGSSLATCYYLLANSPSNGVEYKASAHWITYNDENYIYVTPEVNIIGNYTYNMLLFDGTNSITKSCPISITDPNAYFIYKEPLLPGFAVIESPTEVYTSVGHVDKVNQDKENYLFDANSAYIKICRIGVSFSYFGTHYTPSQGGFEIYINKKAFDNDGVAGFALKREVPIVLFKDDKKLYQGSTTAYISRTDIDPSGNFTTSSVDGVILQSDLEESLNMSELTNNDIVFDTDKVCVSGSDKGISLFLNTTSDNAIKLMAYCGNIYVNDSNDAVNLTSLKYTVQPDPECSLYDYIIKDSDILLECNGILMSVGDWLKPESFYSYNKSVEGVSFTLHPQVRITSTRTAGAMVNVVKMHTPDEVITNPVSTIVELAGSNNTASLNMHKNLWAYNESGINSFCTLVPLSELVNVFGNDIVNTEDLSSGIYFGGYWTSLYPRRMKDSSGIIQTYIPFYELSSRVAFLNHSISKQLSPKEYIGYSGYTNYIPPTIKLTDFNGNTETLKGKPVWDEAKQDDVWICEFPEWFVDGKFKSAHVDFGDAEGTVVEDSEHNILGLRGLSPNKTYAINLLVDPEVTTKGGNYAKVTKRDVTVKAFVDYEIEELQGNEVIKSTKTKEVQVTIPNVDVYENAGATPDECYIRYSSLVNEDRDVWKQLFGKYYSSDGPGAVKVYQKGFSVGDILVTEEVDSGVTVTSVSDSYNIEGDTLVCVGNANSGNTLALRLAYGGPTGHKSYVARHLVGVRRYIEGVGDEYYIIRDGDSVTLNSITPEQYVKYRYNTDHNNSNGNVKCAIVDSKIQLQDIHSSYVLAVESDVMGTAKLRVKRYIIDYKGQLKLLGESEQGAGVYCHEPDTIVAVETKFISDDLFSQYGLADYPNAMKFNVLGKRSLLENSDVKILATLNPSEYTYDYLFKENGSYVPITQYYVNSPVLQEDEKGPYISMIYTPRIDHAIDRVDIIEDTEGNIAIQDFANSELKDSAFCFISKLSTQDSVDKATLADHVLIGDSLTVDYLDTAEGSENYTEFRGFIGDAIVESIDREQHTVTLSNIRSDITIITAPTVEGLQESATKYDDIKVKRFVDGRWEDYNELEFMITGQSVWGSAGIKSQYVYCSPVDVTLHNFNELVAVPTLFAERVNGEYVFNVDTFERGDNYFMQLTESMKNATAEHPVELYYMPGNFVNGEVGNRNITSDNLKASEYFSIDCEESKISGDSPVRYGNTFRYDSWVNEYDNDNVKSIIGDNTGYTVDDSGALVIEGLTSKQVVVLKNTKSPNSTGTTIKVNVHELIDSKWHQRFSKDVQLYNNAMAASTNKEYLKTDFISIKELEDGLNESTVDYDAGKYGTLKFDLEGYNGQRIFAVGAEENLSLNWYPKFMGSLNNGEGCWYLPIGNMHSDVLDIYYLPGGLTNEEGDNGISVTYQVTSTKPYNDSSFFTVKAVVANGNSIYPDGLDEKYNVVLNGESFTTSLKGSEEWDSNLELINDYSAVNPTDTCNLTIEEVTSPVQITIGTVSRGDDNPAVIYYIPSSSGHLVEVGRDNTLHTSSKLPVGSSYYLKTSQLERAYKKCRDLGIEYDYVAPTTAGDSTVGTMIATVVSGFDKGFITPDISWSDLFFMNVSGSSNEVLSYRTKTETEFVGQFAVYDKFQLQSGTLGYPLADSSESPDGIYRVVLMPSNSRDLSGCKKWQETGYTLTTNDLANNEDYFAGIYMSIRSAKDLSTSEDLFVRYEQKWVLAGTGTQDNPYILKLPMEAKDYYYSKVYLVDKIFGKSPNTIPTYVDEAVTPHNYNHTKDTVVDENGRVYFIDKLTDMRCTRLYFCNEVEVEAKYTLSAYVDGELKDIQLDNLPGSQYDLYQGDIYAAVSWNTLRSVLRNNNFYFGDVKYNGENKFLQTMRKDDSKLYKSPGVVFRLEAPQLHKKEDYLIAIQHYVNGQDVSYNSLNEGRLIYLSKANEMLDDVIDIPENDAVLRDEYGFHTVAVDDRVADNTFTASAAGKYYVGHNQTFMTILPSHINDTWEVVKNGVIFPSDRSAINLSEYYNKCGVELRIINSNEEVKGTKEYQALYDEYKLYNPDVSDEDINKLIKAGNTVVKINIVDDKFFIRSGASNYPQFNVQYYVHTMEPVTNAEQEKLAIEYSKTEVGREYYGLELKDGGKQTEKNGWRAWYDGAPSGGYTTSCVSNALWNTDNNGSPANVGIYSADNKLLNYGGDLPKNVNVSGDSHVKAMYFYNANTDKKLDSDAQPGVSKVPGKDETTYPFKILTYPEFTALYRQQRFYYDPYPSTIYFDILRESPNYNLLNIWVQADYYDNNVSDYIDYEGYLLKNGYNPNNLTADDHREIVEQVFKYNYKTETIDGKEVSYFVDLDSSGNTIKIYRDGDKYCTPSWIIVPTCYDYEWETVSVNKEGGTEQQHILWCKFDNPNNRSFLNIQPDMTKTSDGNLTSEVKYIWIHEDTMFRLEYNGISAGTMAIPAIMYDYDATSNKSLSNSTNYGINNQLSYLAFGNSSGSTRGSTTVNGSFINRANSSYFQSCSFGIVNEKQNFAGVSFNDEGRITRVPALSGLVSGSINLSKDLNLMFQHDSNDDTIGSDFRRVYDFDLNYNRRGDTFTLSSLDYEKTDGDKIHYTGSQTCVGSNLDLETLYHTGNYGHIMSNNFWPLDDEVFTSDGDGKLPSVGGNGVPAWDDGAGDGHNPFLGMYSEFEFSIPENYIGPLDFMFYGDDDMFVFLDDQLICDIGGTHSSAGLYVNLWDYIADFEDLYYWNSTEKHTLRFYYTERGSSGSTCWIRFTIPMETLVNVHQEKLSSSMRLKKEVDNSNNLAASGSEYEFIVDFFQKKNTSAEDVVNLDGTDENVSLTEEELKEKFTDFIGNTSYYVVDKYGNLLDRNGEKAIDKENLRYGTGGKPLQHMYSYVVKADASNNPVVPDVNGYDNGNVRLYKFTLIDDAATDESGEESGGESGEESGGESGEESDGEQSPIDEANIVVISGKRYSVTDVTADLNNFKDTEAMKGTFVPSKNYYKQFKLGTTNLTFGVDRDESDNVTGMRILSDSSLVQYEKDGVSETLPDWQQKVVNMCTEATGWEDVLSGRIYTAIMTSDIARSYVSSKRTHIVNGVLVEEDNTSTIKLRDGETALFAYLPVNMAYRVRELNSDEMREKYGTYAYDYLTHATIDKTIEIKSDRDDKSVVAMGTINNSLSNTSTDEPNEFPTVGNAPRDYFETEVLFTNVLFNYGDEMPDTGGMGIKVIYVVASMFLFASGVLVFMKRRRKF